RNKTTNHHFMKLNFNIIRDINDSKIDGSKRWEKFLYQDYRFDKFINSNTCTIIHNDKKIEFSEPIISIGRNENNAFQLDDSTVSRRHCAIINYPKDVWIYNLG